MDFNVIFQLRTKKFWWMDVIFYFAISLLIATVFCYVIFLTKNNFQKQDIAKEAVALQTVGTENQKDQEKEVIDYQKKINDFTKIFQNHEFASNVFGFLQQQTIPNVWFSQFNLDQKAGQVQLSGESDDLDALSRQISQLEKNKYVQSLGSVTSSLGESARTEFSFNLKLDPKIFSYLSDVSLSQMASSVSLAQQQALQPNQPGGQVSGQLAAPVGADQKIITSFHLLLDPEVAAIIDQTNYLVKLSVPYGTDVRSVPVSIVISPGATVTPVPDSPQNFTSPVTYTVIAQDGTTQSYKVSVNILPKGGVKTQAAQSSSNMLMIMIIIIVIILIVIGVILFVVWRRMQSKKSSNLNL